MPFVSRGNGYIRSEFQTLHLWLSGTFKAFSGPFPYLTTPYLDLPFLLAPHQGESQQTLSCLPASLYRRCCGVQAHWHSRVCVAHPIIMTHLLMMYLGDKSHKRLTQQKKQRERERKELDTLGRRHLANVRVVQRNVVYVVGIGPRFAKEEVRPFLPQIF